MVATKEKKLIKLLKRLSENADHVSKSFKESGSDETAAIASGESLGYCTVQWLIEDDIFFKDVYEIYFGKEQENEN